MKRLKYGLLAAAMVASVAVAPAVASAEEAATTATEEAKVTKKAKVGGKWVKSDAGWWYSYDDGTYASYEFVSGWWVNKAGYWGDADGDHSTYAWYTQGGEWHYGNRTWSCGSEYANDDEDGKAKWWKIDGQWYYFLEDGALVTSAVVGNYIVDNTGAWLEGYKGQWRHGATNKVDWWYAICDEDGKLVDWFDWSDGVVMINGYNFIFDEEGWLYTDAIVPYEVDEDDYIFLAPDKNGYFGDYTSFQMGPYAHVPYTMTMKFDSDKDVAKAAKQLKQFLIATVAQNKATEAYTFPLAINDVERNIIVGKLMDYDVVDGEDGYFDDDDQWVEPVAASIKWSQTATNVYVNLSFDETLELFEMIADEDYDGTVGFDATDEDIKECIKDKDAAIPFLDGDLYIPLVNYVEIFVEGKEFTIDGYAAINEILDAYRFGAAAYDFEVKLEVGDAEVKLNSFAVDANAINMTIDGKEYGGIFVYTTDTHKVDGKDVEFYDDLFFVFMGNRYEDLAPVLEDMGLIDGCWVVDSNTQTVLHKTVEVEEDDSVRYHYGDWTWQTDLDIEEAEETTDWE
jgi:hypothetical protein